MITRASVDDVRAELARSCGAQPPSGVQRLAPAVFLLATDGVASDARATLATLAHRTERWLASNLAPARFPALLIHTGKGCPLVPKAHLYPDGLVNVVHLRTLELKPDLVIHELTHALASIREEWPSELLAYYAGFSGLDAVSTFHLRTLSAFAIELDDLVRTGLSLWSVLSPADAIPGVRYDPTNPYAGFMFLRCFEELELRAGRRGVFEYLRCVDAESAAGKAALFTRLFRASREGLVRELAGSSELGLRPAEASHALAETLERGLEDVERRWWADGFELAYLRTAFSKWKTPVSEDATLYLDYRLYRSQRESGSQNALLRRHLLRRSRDVLAKHGASARSSYVRYFLLTDHALAEFRGRMSALPAEDPEVFASLLRSVAELERFPKSQVTRTALAHFHLFYPEAFGAQRAGGERILKSVLHEEPCWEEAYLHLVAASAANADERAREHWLDEYRARTGSGSGPSILELMTDTQAHRRVA